MTELDTLHYDDLMADLAMNIQQYGARRVLQDFEQRYPELMQELRVQFMRRDSKQIAALLKPNNNAPTS